MPATRTTSPTTVRCHWFLPRWSALWAPHQPAPRSECHQTGGIARHEAPTRRRHTPGRLRVVHNPHRRRCGERRRDHGRAAALERSEGGAAGHVGRGAPWGAGCGRTMNRRAEPKARGADGSRAAYGRTKQPGPTAGPGARKTPGSASNNQRHTATRSALQPTLSDNCVTKPLLTRTCAPLPRASVKERVVQL